MKFSTLIFSSVSGGEGTDGHPENETGKTAKKKKVYIVGKSFGFRSVFHRCSKVAHNSIIIICSCHYNDILSDNHNDLLSDYNDYIMIYRQSLIMIY